MDTLRTIDVPVSPRGYTISIEPSLVAYAGDFTREVAPEDRAFLVIDANVAQTHGDDVRYSLERAGYTVTSFVLEAVETAKVPATVHQLYDAMLESRCRRATPVVAVGGGIVGDVAGFAAATFYRGVPLIQVPTTLLAMVDASIGGKTGVNYPVGGPDTLGKNLIGSFWQPWAVVVDPGTLGTLDDRHLRCGLAESIKHGLIADIELLEMIEANVESVLNRDKQVLTELIARSAAIKVDIVLRDTYESGMRMWLNLGHTFAHAIEPIAELGLHHGEAVAIGMSAAAHCSLMLKRMGPWQVERIEQVLANAGLPTRLPEPIDVERLMSLMELDKKATHTGLRLILPLGLGSVGVVEDVQRETVIDAWRAVGASTA